MSEVSIIGLDIAKSVFQVHGADASGRAVLRKKVSRAKLLQFFGSQPPARWSWKLAGARITGRVNWRSWAMMSG